MSQQAGSRQGPPHTPAWLALAMLAVASLSWAGSGVAGRAAAGNIPPMTMSSLRWIGALLLFLPFGALPLWRQRRIIRAHFPLLCVFALFGVVGFTAPYYIGLQYTTAINTSLLNATGPLMIFSLSAALLGMRVTLRGATGLVLGLAGALLIMARGNPDVFAMLELNPGDLLVSSAFMSWAIYTVLLRWRPAGLQNSAFLLALSAIATVMMLPPLAWELAGGAALELTAPNAVILGYTILFPSVLGYVCWNRGVAALGPGVAAVMQYLIPVFGVLLSMAILGEAVQEYHIVGFVAIFTGVYLATGRRERSASSQS